MAQIFASERSAPRLAAASKSPPAGSSAPHQQPGAGLATLQAQADTSTSVRQLAKWAATGIAQREENTSSGLPDGLRSGVEALSGYAMDDVKVHYNSQKPAELNAHAYAQGTDIHLASGQEKHLPHEAWHTVQQKQGRVAPTHQLQGKVAINDDTGLEKEADVMGEKAMQAGGQMMAKRWDR